MVLTEIEKMTPAEAIKSLDAFIALHPDSDEAYTMRGLRHWALGNRAKAINDYHTAIRLNPGSSAVHALEMANDILSFFNKDLLNP